MTANLLSTLVSYFKFFVKKFNVRKVSRRKISQKCKFLHEWKSSQIDDFFFVAHFLNYINAVK